ncbi:MAG TPA: GNAT family N-acetyltransferase [Thermoanaerobaculia bacterium]|nr:GNAT family N-acetyltransferase [Thermoanaerobaculia bacterium]
MPVDLLDVTTDRGLEPFLGLQTEVYRGDPGYIPSTRKDILASLFRPDFAGAQRAWVALENNHPVARIVARRSPTLRDEAGLPYGMLCFFEALPASNETVRRLFEESIRWLQETGAGAILGPMDGDTWHKHRLNVGPWDDPPFLLEPYNPPYYPALWEARGFTVLERYLSKRVDAATVAAFLEPKRQAALAAGYQLRRLDPGRFQDELRTIYRISVRIFARNFLYTDIPEEEFFALYAGARSLLDPDFVWFARSPEGEDIGFLFAFPDRFRAVAAMRGRRDPLALLRFFLHRNEADAVNMKTVGVLPEHRRAGLGAALMGQGHRMAVEKGYRFANHCLFREGNPSGEMDGGTGRVMRRYHLYKLAA